MQVYRIKNKDNPKYGYYIGLHFERTTSKCSRLVVTYTQQLQQAASLPLPAKLDEQVNKNYQLEVVDVNVTLNSETTTTSLDNNVSHFYIPYYPEWLGDTPRHSASWSPSETEAVSTLYNMKTPIKEIAKLCGRSEVAIEIVLNKLGLFIDPMPNEEDELKQLKKLGYCVVSNKHNLVARLDREDWLSIIIEKLQLHNYIQKYGLTKQDLTGYADHYRRCYSKDTIKVSDYLRKHLPNSGASQDTTYRGEHGTTD